MIEAEYPDDKRSDDGVKRRSTFTPPAEDAEVPVTLGEGAVAVPPEPPQPVADTPPSTRSSQRETPAPGQAPAPDAMSDSLPYTPSPAPSSTPQSTPPSDAPSPPQPPAPAEFVQPPAPPVQPVQPEQTASVPPQSSTPEASSGWDESVLAPPERRSLSDQEIMANMGQEGTETGALINALQEQMDLRKREDSEFEGWEALIRQSFPEEEAENIVLRGRAQFEGVPVESLTPQSPPPAATNTPPEVPTPPQAEPVASVSEADDAPGPVPEAAPELVEPQPDTQAQSETVESEPIILPRWGGVLAPEEPVGEGSQPALQPEEHEDQQQSPGVHGSFEQILVDPDAVTPPTDAWPLAGVLDQPEPAQQDSEAGLLEDLVDNTGEGEPAPGGPDSQSYEADLQRQPETHQSNGVGVTASATEQQPVSVQQALATKPVTEIPLEGLGPQKSNRFGFDHVGAEPTADNVRTDKATQLLWAWWALGTPLPVVLLGVWLIDTGLSLGQAVTAGVVGALLAAIPLVLGTLKGAQSGLPTLVSSRAAFGMVGNIVPAVFMVLIRIFVAAVVLWGASWMATGVLVESNYWNGEPALMQVILGAVFALVAAGLAIAGRGWVTIALWSAAGMGLLGAIGLFVATLDQLSGEALRRTDGALSTTVAGTAVVMSVLVVFWSHFGGDIARFQRNRSGPAGPSVAAVAAVIPVVGLIAWGALLGGSGDENRSLLFTDFFDTVLGDAPGWYPIPALILGALPLVAIAALSVHSSGYAVLSLGIRIPRYAAATLAGGLSALGVIALIVFAPTLTNWLIDVALVGGVLSAAWVGIFAGEVVTRRVYVDPRVLAGSSGNFPGFRIAPVLGFIGAIALGLGLLTLDTPWLQGVGYLLGPFQQWGLGDLSSWQLGPFVALLVGFVVAALAGIRGGVHTSERRSAKA